MRLGKTSLGMSTKMAGDARGGLKARYGVSEAHFCVGGERTSRAGN